MKVKFSVIYDKHTQHNEEHDFECSDYDAVLRSLRDAVELHKLRYAEAKREQAVREAERRIAMLVELNTPEPKRDDGPHARVFEYDGAFRCHDCDGQWGALPGKPPVPKLCVKQYLEAT